MKHNSRNNSECVFKYSYIEMYKLLYFILYHIKMSFIYFKK